MKTPNLLHISTVGSRAVPHAFHTLIVRHVQQNEVPVCYEKSNSSYLALYSVHQPQNQFQSAPFHELTRQ